MENNYETYDDKKWELKRKKEKTFWTNWEQKRKHKIRYAFIHGSLLWGLPVYILPLLWDVLIDSESFILRKAIIKLSAFLIAGFFFGLYSFNNKENLYQEYIKYINEKED